MPHNLIINARDALSWPQRLGGHAGTLLLWALWLWLWQPLLKAINALLHWGFNARLPLLSNISVEGPALTLAGTALALLLWNQLPRRQTPQARLQPSLDDYAGHFGLSVQAVSQGQAQQICVVHHDAQGRIVAIAPQQG